MSNGLRTTAQTSSGSSSPVLWGPAAVQTMTGIFRSVAVRWAITDQPSTDGIIRSRMMQAMSSRPFRMVMAAAPSPAITLANPFRSISVSSSLRVGASSSTMRTVPAMSGVRSHETGVISTGHWRPVHNAPVTRNARSIAAVLLAVILAAGAITAAGRAAHVNPLTAALLFLLAVLFAATLRGQFAGVCASVAAAASLNYFFFPPLGTLHIADAENWTALGAFLIVSTVASRLVTRARGEAERANATAAEIAQLYGISVQLFGAATAAEGLPALRRTLMETGATGGGVVFFTAAGDIDATAGDDGAQWDAITLQRARSIRLHHKTLEFAKSDDTRDLFVPVERHGEPAGAVVALGTRAAKATIESMARLLTASLEREYLLRERAHVDALRETDAMRTALVRAVSHDLSTPLTAMQLQVDALRRQLAGSESSVTVTALAADVARLKRRIESLLAMARLEMGNVRPRQEPTPPVDLLRLARESVRSIASARPVTIEVTADCPDALVDPSLALEILVNLIENAHRASPAEAEIALTARTHPDDPSRVRLGILDRGAGLPAADSDVLPRGLGLEIATSFAQANGGAVSLAPRDGGGTCAWVDLPAAPTEAAA
jgi:two-component system sensor histidine kinase KdpD